NFANDAGSLLHLSFWPYVHRLSAAGVRLSAVGFWPIADSRLPVADHVAHVEFETPAVVAVLRHAIEFQRTDLRRAGGECDGDALRAASLAATEDGMQRRQLQQLLGSD